MGYKIVTESSSTIRAIARDNLRGYWGKVLIGVILWQVLIALIPSLLSYIPAFTYESYNELLEQNIEVSYLSSLYHTFLTGTFEVGICSFMLSFFRHKDANPGYVFNGFNIYPKTLLLTIAIGFFTFMWLLLLIVPGIIAAFRYSQATYVMADDPSKGALQSITESKNMMRGNKFKFFCLELSFIGWLILASIPSAVFDAFGSSGISHIIISFVLNIPIMLVLVYMNTATVAFYDLVTGRLVAREEPVDFNF